MRRHPSLRSAFRFASSRAMLRRNFACQNRLFDDGVEATLQPGCRCQ
jgi:hypothetical protein